MRIRIFMNASLCKRQARDCDEHRFPMCELFERSHRRSGYGERSSLDFKYHEMQEKGSDCKVETITTRNAINASYVDIK